MSPYYKGVKVNSFGLPVFLENKSGRIKTKERKKNFYHTTFSSPFKKDAPRNLMVLYDIPEAKKKERDWFRRQLQAFGFKMVQRSVWVGPAPLPKAFLSYVKHVGIEKDFKTFKLAKSSII
jgi:DNA-binding transcriptional regulator PaaX